VERYFSRYLLERLKFVFKIYIVCTSLPIEPYSAIVRQKACLGCFNVIFILGVKMKKVRRRGVILWWCSITWWICICLCFQSTESPGFFPGFSRPWKVLEIKA